ncbi:MAG: 50S ribosomal protein L30 [Luteitalea sp.]|nr:50S ribosomal protein L30 [Luteitalea sp.]
MTKTSVESTVAPDAARQSDSGALRITLIRSTIGYDRKQATVVRGLGLRRIGHTVVVKDDPSRRGMIAKVRHLVKVDHVSE